VNEILADRKFKKCLDIGCGKGDLLYLLRDRYVEGYGTDIITKKGAYRDFNFVQADINKEFPFKNNKFDLIICTEVIEQIENQYFLLRELKKRLSKNGLLIVSAPNIYNVFGKMLFNFSNELIHFTTQPQDYDQINPLIENHFRYYTNEIGLKIVDVRYTEMHVPFTGIHLPIKTKLTGNSVIFILKNK